MTTKHSPELYGLVLAGGRSTRMGFDKGLIQYRELPHREYLYQLLGRYCQKTFLGLRPDQAEAVPADVAVVVDDDRYQGPFRSLLSAYQAYPDKAWLVLACDLPFFNEQVLAQLVQERNSSKQATAFFNASSGFLEPLIAIWEPESLQQAQTYAAAGGRCPRKLLMELEIKQLTARQEKLLTNANYPEEYKTARNEMGRRSSEVS